jgi:PAS domain S-box-containing protein
MIIAMGIGFYFVFEGQIEAIQQNQSTAAQKTAEGVWLALQGRLRFANQLSQDDFIVDSLRAAKNGAAIDFEEIDARLRRKSASIGRLQSSFSLFDAQGTFIAGKVGEEAHTQFDPRWSRFVRQPEVVSSNFLNPNESYTVRILAPVFAVDSEELLGYVSEVQPAVDLVEFVLGGGKSDENVYEVVYMGQERQLRVRRGDYRSDGTIEILADAVDAALGEHLLQERAMFKESSLFWRYTAQDKTYPALLAYHRLFEQTEMYIVVHRSLLPVLHHMLATMLTTFAVSVLVIACFCIIGYRIINNTIIRPVSLLNEGAQIIRQGDFELKLKVSTGDEIEELASSFNQMAAALRLNIRQLGESEEKYRNLITSMRDGIYQTDAHGFLSFMNPVGAEIFGVGNVEALLGRDLREFFMEELDYAKLSAQLVKHHFVEHTRVWMRKEDTGKGRAICVEMSANQLVDQSGEVLGIEGTFRDVTQHVRLEKEARERSERLSAVNQIANTINSSLEAGGVYESICAEVRRWVHFDFASITMMDNLNTDYETRELFPRPQPGTYVHGAGATTRAEETCAAWVVRNERYLVIPRLHDAAAQESSQENLPTGAEFPDTIEACLCLPLYAEGRIIGTLNLGADGADGFTKQKIESMAQLTPHVAVAIRNARLLENLQHSLEEVTRGQEKLHELNEELKTLDEMKTNLLSNVSHELRTPLVSVMGYTDMLLHGKVGPMNEVQREYLQISLRNVEKLVTLIENLLDFSRLHRGAEEMVFDTFDLVDCVATSLQIIQPVADGRGIELRFDSNWRRDDEEGDSGGEILVDGDKGKLGQVFNNLLSNATKFNDKDGVVTVTLLVRDEAVDVSVSDTGIGMPQDALDKVFTRFYQCDSSSTRKYGGTGIGLAIAQDIVRLHGGRITVESALEQGSTFHFSLALKKHSKDGTLPASSMHNDHPSPTETHLLVEVVSQDRALTNQVRQILFSEGMDIIHAPYPPSAISLSNRYNPDCLILDAEAGASSNILLQDFLAQPGADLCPVILLTNEDALYEKYRTRIAARVRRGFRKSTLLSGIHYALSQGVETGEQLGGKILCVDDDPEIVTFMTRCLEAEGYACDSCPSGNDALQRVQSKEYWLVLLDLAMPGLDGWETCRKIKSDYSLAGIKVYLVTAKLVTKVINKVHECGADGYVIKPFKAEELLGVVQSYENRPANPSDTKA